MFENYPIDEALRRSRHDFRIIEVHSRDRTLYPLMLVVYPGRDLHLRWSWEGAHLDREQIAVPARVLGEPRTGAHGKPVVFLHPKDFLGTLIELEQV